MEIVKKNIVSIICGVVALAALVFYLFGVKPKFSDLHHDMEALTNKPQQIAQIESTPRMLPLIVPGDQRKLDVFPNEQVIATGKNLVDRLAEEAKKVVKQAVLINQGKAAGSPSPRTLLVPGSLPLPRPASLAFSFRTQYNEMFKRGGRPGGNGTSLPDMLQAGEPPTEAEIARAKYDLWDKQYKPQIELRDGQPVNRKEVEADYLRTIANFDEDFRRKRALTSKVYLDPTALVPSQNIVTGTAAPSAENMWYAQVALWVQQDVCRAIATLNQTSPNIPNSPVKHLLSIDVKQDITMYTLKGGAGSAPAAAPGNDLGGGGTAAGPAGQVVDIDAKDYTLSPTGRVCNRLYDVVQFNVTAVVDAKAVKPFIQQLQYAQFINVVEVDIQGVDLDESLDEGYEYGKRPVVEVRMRCEALFLRDWTAWVPPANPEKDKPIQGPMPLEVQRLLGITSPLAPKPQPVASDQPTNS